MRLYRSVYTPGLIGCPRRSAPGPGNLIAPNSVPCGMVRVMLGSEELPPLGSDARNQISQKTVPLSATILVPCCSSAWLIAGASSEGGAPAGSLLYWPKAAPAIITKHRTDLLIALATIVNVSGSGDALGAGDGIRTRDIDLGKVALYQLSYSRSM